MGVSVGCERSAKQKVTMTLNLDGLISRLRQKLPIRAAWRGYSSPDFLRASPNAPLGNIAARIYFDILSLLFKSIYLQLNQLVKTFAINCCYRPNLHRWRCSHRLTQPSFGRGALTDVEELHFHSPPRLTRPFCSNEYSMSDTSRKKTA